MPIEFTPEELRHIEVSLEVKRRERCEIAEESARLDCELGSHAYKDGKCRYCRAEKPPEAAPQKKVFSPIDD